MHSKAILFTALLLAVSTAGCDDEPIDLGVNDGAGGNAGEAEMGGEPAMGGEPTGGMPMGGTPMGGTPMGGAPMGGTPMGGQDRVIDCGDMVGVYLADIASFAQCVAPHLAAACEGCHTARPFEYNSIPAAESPQGHQRNLQSFLQYSSAADPAGSDVLVHHDHMYIPLDSERYRNLLRWIEARATPPPPPPPPMGGMMGTGGAEAMGGMMGMGGAAPVETVPCNGLPQGDGIGNPGFRASFGEGINTLLVQECNNFGGCHGERGGAGGLWYLPLEDACSSDWNFTVTQLYINPRDLNSSLILTKPLGFGSADNTHGGAEVFNGTADESYVTLRNWLIAGLQ